MKYDLCIQHFQSIQSQWAAVKPLGADCGSVSSSEDECLHDDIYIFYLE